MGSKYDQIRKELDLLGYRQKLLPECVPLVEKLLADLNITTVNLQKYMKISQHAMEERDNLELGAEPYKCDNAKLIKECNDLHIAFIHFKDKHEKIQRDLRNQISTLQASLENCNLEKNNIMSQLQQLERERCRKASRSGVSKDPKVGKEKKTTGTTSIMVPTEECILRLKKDFKELKEIHEQLIEENVVYKNQLVTRDEEISRLQSLIEGGRSYKAASKDCCYQNVDGQMSLLQEEVTRLKKEKEEFLMHIKDAVAKQHEAMRRALHLAERNKQLEKEMRDIDEIALAVEAECNNTVKGNTEKVTRLQDRMNESLILIQNLERDNAKLKQAKLELSADLDAIKLEKVHLQKQLESEKEDKKRLNDRINNFTMIENDLNLEIDRLTKLTAEQKRKIVELESQISPEKLRRPQKESYQNTELEKEESEMSDKKSQTVNKKGSLRQKTEHKKTCKKSLKSKGGSPTKMGSNHHEDAAEFSQKCCCEYGTCMKNLKELLDKEMEYRQTQVLQSLETLKQEKEYYMKEYHKALEQMRNVPTLERSDNLKAQESMQELMDCRQKLNEKEIIIKELESEIRQMKNSAMGGPEFPRSDDVCTNPNCKRKEREMGIKKNELEHIEIENNALKTKLQTLNETTLFNEERMKKAFKEMEEHIRKLEDERRDLVKAEVTHRTTASQLEEDYKHVKEQLKQTQNELNVQRANYNQLKLLHEQTDRALSEAQAKTVRAETELVNYQSKVKDSSRDTAAYDREISKLTSDIKIMKNQLSKLDREKDDLLNQLDEKTEKIASLEEEVNKKNKTVGKLEEELKDLKRKLSKYEDETSSQDHLVRSTRQELNILEQDYEKEKRLKEAAVLENKRLQNDLASIACDCRNARNELEISNRQVEDLKRQLQQYISEVKRTEDLISNKELERNELLDQFRCLSQEANILESNNHTLENEATQTKVQLSVALDHSSELERKLENQESIIRSYEKQISELTTQVASMELQLKQTSREHEHFSNEMKQMRDLCVKLDKEKDNLKHQLYSKDDSRAQVDKVSEKLLSEKETLKTVLEKERKNLEAVEKLLNEARQEVIEQRMLNEDLQGEVGRLKQKISEIQEKLPRSHNPDHKTKFVEVLPETPKKTPLFPDEINPNQQESNPPYRGHSALSTNTLEVSRKYHGSDNVMHGTIDLTKLYQDNSGCSEHCDKDMCRNYEKPFLKVHSQDELPKSRDGHRAKPNGGVEIFRKRVFGDEAGSSGVSRNSSKHVVEVAEDEKQKSKEMRKPGIEQKPSDRIIDLSDLQADVSSLYSTKSLQSVVFERSRAMTDLTRLWSDHPSTEKLKLKPQEGAKSSESLKAVWQNEKTIYHANRETQMSDKDGGLGFEGFDRGSQNKNAAKNREDTKGKTVNKMEKRNTRTESSDIETSVSRKQAPPKIVNLSSSPACSPLHRDQSKQNVAVAGKSSPVPNSSKTKEHRKEVGQSPENKGVAYDIVWSKCRCRVCWSSLSVSEPDVRGRCLERGLSAQNKCRRKGVVDKRDDDASKSLLEKKNDKPLTFIKSPKVNENKNKQSGSYNYQCNKPLNVNKASEKHKESETALKKISKNSKATCTQSNAQVQAEFSQDSDDSAIFRKTFSIDGVALQCHCCISSFKTHSEN